MINEPKRDSFILNEMLHAQQRTRTINCECEKPEISIGVFYATIQIGNIHRRKFRSKIE